MHAREKAGKSTLIGAAVAAVTRGRPFLGMSTIIGDVLWAYLANHPWEFVRRLWLTSYRTRSRRQK